MSFRSYGRRALLCAVMFLGLASTVSAEAVRLQWDPNTEPGITGYTVAYGTRSGVYTSTVGVGLATTYTLNLTTPGTYFIAVSASSASGTSNYSAEVSTTIPTGPVSNAHLIVDQPVANQVLSPDVFISGWALDFNATSGTGVDAVHIYAYPNPGSGTPPVFLGVGAYGSARGDVGALYGAQFTNSGYTLPVPTLGPGRYDFVVFGRSTVSGTFSLQKVIPVTVAPATVASPGAQLFIDMPRTGDNIFGALTVAGWGADFRSTTGTGVNAVDVYAYPAPGSGTLPIFIGSARYGFDRIDVGAAMGARFRPSGFDVTVVSLPTGPYDVVAFPRSTVTGRFENPRIIRVNVRPSMIVTVDVPAIGSTVPRNFAIQGWALDRRSGTNSGVDALHVWAYRIVNGVAQSPVFLGATTTVIPRADVAGIYGPQFGISGYALTVSTLAAGTYDLVVFGQSHATGQFENATVVRVTVQ